MAKSILSLAKQILTIAGIIIFSTILLVSFIISLPYPTGKVMAVVFGILIGTMVITCFIYLFFRKEWVAIIIIIYLALLQIGVPMYLFWRQEWAQDSPGSVIYRITKLIQHNSVIYGIAICFSLLPLIFIMSRVKFFRKKMPDLFKRPNLFKD